MRFSSRRKKMKKSCATGFTYSTARRALALMSGWLYRAAAFLAVPCLARRRILYDCRRWRDSHLGNVSTLNRIRSLILLINANFARHPQPSGAGVVLWIDIADRRSRKRKPVGSAHFAGTGFITIARFFDYLAHWFMREAATMLGSFWKIRGRRVGRKEAYNTYLFVVRRHSHSSWPCIL